MSRLKLKVCGMRNPENINELVELKPDFIGFIFYSKSPRFASDIHVDHIPKTISRVGVFVNESFEEIQLKADQFGLDYIQLHGDEDESMVLKLKEAGLKVIKVFRVSDQLPDTLEAFDGIADLFLFDTDDKKYGGSGRQFNWSILKNYKYNTPYLLSGGIDIGDVATIKQMNLPKIQGLDVNSRFEFDPGLKDIMKVSKLIEQL